MRQHRDDLVERNFSKEPLARQEVTRLVGLAGGVDAVLNTRNKTVRERGWKANPPSTEAFIASVLQDNNLIRRPLLVVGETVVVGKDEAAYQDLLG